MKIVIAIFVILPMTCFLIGMIVSKLEKKKGWVEGHTPYGVYEKHFKRPLDLALSLYALIFLWPFLLLIAFAVRINMGSPVLFSQKRPGLDGRIFTIRKFRTMTDARDPEGNLLPDEKRLTGFGRFLRASSADELFELINILNGDMAIVGPRPQLVRDMVFMDDEQLSRHSVRPGLTGLAQVMGRNSISWEEKFKWDLAYVEKITFGNDLKILFRTIGKVVGRKETSDELEITDDFGDALLKAGKIGREKYDELQEKAKALLEKK